MIPTKRRSCLSGNDLRRPKPVELERKPIAAAPKAGIRPSRDDGQELEVAELAHPGQGIGDVSLLGA